MKVKNLEKELDKTPLWKKMIVIPLGIIIGLGTSCTILAFLYAVIVILIQAIFTNHLSRFATLFKDGFLPFNVLEMQYWMWILQLGLGMFLAMVVIAIFLFDKTEPITKEIKKEKDKVLAQQQININFNLKLDKETAQQLIPLIQNNKAINDNDLSQLTFKTKKEEITLNKNDKKLLLDVKNMNKN